MAKNPPNLPPAPGSGDAPDPLSAKSKFSCPVCGGEAQWNPGKQALVCVYCGTESPAKLDVATGEIQEHDLATALRKIPDQDRGWGTQKKTVRCQHCKAISVFPPERVSQRCDFCGSTALVPYDQEKPPITPESLLAFQISETKARELVRKWYGEVWFAPDRLKKAAMTDTVKGYYLPYWTFDSQAHCPWEAEAGYYYYETEYYTDNNGNQASRQVQRTRWQYASGVVDNFFDDELVCASKGVQADMLREIEPFPTTSHLVKYDPGFLSGWVVEQYQLDLVGGAQRARQQMTEKLRAMCSQQVPGDTQRNLQIDPQFSADTFKHLLLPIWLLSYNFSGTAYQVVINGYTGSIAGKYPKSWVKITLLILTILIVILIIAKMAGKK